MESKTSLTDLRSASVTSYLLSLSDILTKPDLLRLISLTDLRTVWPEINPTAHKDQCHWAEIGLSNLGSVSQTAKTKLIILPHWPEISLTDLKDADNVSLTSKISLGEPKPALINLKDESHWPEINLIDLKHQNQ